MEGTASTMPSKNLLSYFICFKMFLLIFFMDFLFWKNNKCHGLAEKEAKAMATQQFTEYNKN